MKEVVHITPESDIPKYKQIVSTIQASIEKGLLKQGDVLPSLNQIRDEFNVSRDTVIKAYQDLKSLGLISSSPGKGNYVTGSSKNRNRHVFLQFDEFSAYKETVYNSLKETIQAYGVLDLYFHHFNEQLFYDLIKQSLGKYTDYVIMPLSPANHLESFSCLFHTENIYILDQGGKVYGEKFPSVCQDFNHDIYTGLSQGLEQIKKYKQIIMVIDKPENPSRELMTNEMISGFNRFCQKNQVNGSVVHTGESIDLQKGFCYLIHPDRELVQIVKKIESENWNPGKDIGLISFNDTPLKEISAGGITTLSTDFEMMGKTMGQLILNHGQEHIKNPIRLILRKTL